MRWWVPLARWPGSVRAALDRLFTDCVILGVGWALFLVYAYPGYMSADSCSQLNQARGVEPINEWHPPMMSFIWRTPTS